MIDKKKIEEAASQYATAQFSNYDIHASTAGFKAGINWFLDNLWHDASEEPMVGKGLIVEKVSSKGKIRITDDTKKSLWDCWQTKVEKEGITRWLYIDDLLKGGING